MLVSNFPRSDLAEKVALLARPGIYVGTSSWKYEGWLGLIYTPERYMTRGKLSRAKFEKTCLAEYAVKRLRERLYTVHRRLACLPTILTRETYVSPVMV